MPDCWPDPILTAVLTLVLGGGALALARWSKRIWVEATLASLLGLFAASAVVVGQPTRVWLPAAGLAAFALALAGVRRHGERARRWLTLAGVQAILFFVLGPVAGFTWVAILSDGDEPFLPEPASLQPVNVELTPTAYYALTDLGRSIPLYTRESDMNMNRAEYQQGQQFMFKIIRTAEPESVSNCHGWVFTGGQYWVRGGHVEGILADNGYKPVTTPRVGDLIIYRNSLGEITHTGLVRIAADNVLLIESKWGALGRYLHAPADQPYGEFWDYYRSRRVGHDMPVGPSEVLLAMLDEEEEQ